MGVRGGSVGTAGRSGGWARYAIVLLEAGDHTAPTDVRILACSHPMNTTRGVPCYIPGIELFPSVKWDLSNGISVLSVGPSVRSNHSLCLPHAFPCLKRNNPKRLTSIP